MGLALLFLEQTYPMQGMHAVSHVHQKIRDSNHEGKVLKQFERSRESAYPFLDPPGNLR